MKWVLLLLIGISIDACTKDDYASVPDEVNGYGLLSIDTGLSLKSTFSFDTLNRIDSFETCAVPERIMMKGFDSMLVITYRGVQLFKNNKVVFLHIKGAVSASREDSVTLIVLSTIGKAKLRLKSDLSPELQVFDFSKRTVFPEYGCWLQIEKGLFNIGRKIYIECPNESGRLFYGWEKRKLRKPKCYIS